MFKTEIRKGKKMEITKQDIQALRLCDDVILRHHKGKSGAIEAVKKASWEAKQKNPFLDDKRHIISIDSYLINTKNDSTAFEMIAGPSYSHSTISGAIGFLRDGDDISLEWGKGFGDSESVKNAGMTSDMVFLVVRRKDKRYNFFLAQSITPIGSLARMIKAA